MPCRKGNAMLKKLFKDGEIIEVRLIPGVNKDCHPKSEFIKVNGTVDADIQNIIKNYNPHYNIYFGAHPRTAMGERKKVSRVSSCFIDVDSKNFVSIDAFNSHIQYLENKLFPHFQLLPSIKVISGHGYHFYWVLSENIPEPNWKNIQIAAIDVFNSDPTLKDLPRIIRVPGSMNIKEEPAVKCELVYVNNNTYTEKDFQALLMQYERNQQQAEKVKRAEKEWKNKTYSMNSNDRETFINAVLTTLEEYGQNKFSDYKDFRDFIFACKSEGIPLQRIDSILQQSNGYDAEINEKIYDSAKVDKITFGKAHYFAMEANSECLKKLLGSKKSSNTAIPPIENIPIPTDADDPNHNKPLKKKPQTPVIKQEEIPGMVIYSDMWNSKRMVEFFGDNIRYCRKWKEWMHWNGKNWEADETGQIQEIGKKTVRSFYSMAANMGDDKERSKFVNHIKISENLNRRKAMIEGAQSEPGIPVKPEEFDGDKWLLNVSNGTLNLKTMELLPHDRQNYITKIINVNYNTYAECPTWEAFLNRIFDGNSNYINFLQKAVGYSLTGSTQEQCIFILHGSGANGKSTFTTTIKELLGEYAQQTYSETLMQKKNGQGNGASNDLAMLRGARFVSSVETEEGKAFAESLIKQLSGDDVITARFLFKEFFNFRFEGKIFIATNHEPKIKGTDYAIWRRIKKIPFDITIPPEERDPFLLEKLKAEYEGILNWAVNGCCMWLNEGLKEPEEIRAATEEYRKNMDVLGDFINECCVIGDRRYQSLASDLYKKYNTWCDDAGENALSQKLFGNKLSERGYKKERSHISKNRGKFLYAGIGIIDEKADEQTEKEYFNIDESPF